ncbi:MAG: sigma-54 dependent transcriptional regulator [Pseudomonadota bacterium]
MSDSKSKLQILITDDDKVFLNLLRQEAKALGRLDKFNILTAESGEEALAIAGRTPLDVVVTDVAMPGIDGPELFRKLSGFRPDLPVIILTAYGSVDKAVQAIQQGAYNYFEKPLADLELFWKTIEEAGTRKKCRDEIENLENRPAGAGLPLIGSHPLWQKVVEMVERVGPLPTTVLITGETGTGKSRVAKAIHQAGPRAEGPFVAVSCVEFSGSLLESELFGHEKGAFTGAEFQRKGIFERAHGGVLFLDEIAETSPELQVKLLRVIEGSPFFRIGGSKPIEADFRLIAATNRVLEQEVKAGRFRQDLFYRLNIFPIHVPALRERRSDILSLSLYFLKKICKKLGKPKKSISPAALIALCENEWPGNVRELENMLERAIITANGDQILPADLNFGAAASIFGPSTGATLEEMEKLLILLAMDKAGRNKTQAAEMLGIARKTLGQKLTRYGLADDQDL